MLEFIEYDFILMHLVMWLYLLGCSEVCSSGVVMVQRSLGLFCVSVSGVLLVYCLFQV